MHVLAERVLWINLTFSVFYKQLQAQLMELEEKAAVAGAGKLKADQELTQVCAQLHNWLSFCNSGLS